MDKLSIKERIQIGKEQTKKAREYANYILTTFRIKLNKKIEDDHTCELCRPRIWDDVWFADDGSGICARMDADHPNDRRDKLYSWEEIEIIIASAKEKL